MMHRPDQTIPEHITSILPKNITSILKNITLTMRKVYTLLMAVIVSVVAQAAGTTLDGLCYNLDAEKNTATVTHLLDSDGYNYPELKGAVTVPSTVTIDEVSYTVTAIGTSAFADCEGIESVTLPVTVTSVGNYAFNGCLNLRNVTLPATLAEIGISAFSGTSITEVELSGDITAIKSGTFAGTELERVKLPATVEVIGEKAFAGCAKLREVVLGDRLVSIANGAFERCAALETIEFPSSLRSIGNRAFNGCKSLSRIDLKEVTTVGEEAFEKCPSLAEIDFGSGELSIGYMAFAECIALQTLTIPATVTEIDYAFYDCNGLKSVTFEDGDKPLKVGYAPFANSPFADLYVGRDITTSKTNDAAFSSNKSLTRLVIGDGMTTIQARLFRSIQALEEVTFGANVAEVGYDAFANCSALKTVKCADIADWAKIGFEDADANPLSKGADLYIDGTLLTSLDLPEGAVSIGANSFAGYSRLTAITLPASLKTIGQQAFMGCENITKVTMNGAIEAIGGRAFLNCEAMTEVNSPSLTAWLGNGFETATSSPLAYGAKLYAGGKLVENEVEVPDGVTAIGNFAFADYSLITRLAVPGSVTTIGRSAFADCDKLTEIDLGAAVASIGHRAFNGAPLATITVRNPQPPTFSIASTTATFGSYNAAVFVPKGTLEAYTDNEAWRLFTDIREKELSGISEAATDKVTPFTVDGTTITAAAPITVYDTKGAEAGRLTAGQSLTLPRGIYIVAGGPSRHKLLLP